MPSFEYAPQAGAVHRITQPCGPDNTGLVQAAWLSLSTAGDSAGATVHVDFSGTDYSVTPNLGRYLQGVDVTLAPAVRWSVQVPANTDQIGITIVSADRPIGATLELQAK